MSFEKCTYYMVIIRCIKLIWDNHLFCLGKYWKQWCKCCDWCSYREPQSSPKTVIKACFVMRNKINKKYFSWISKILMFNHSKYHPQLVHKVFLLYENNENDTPLNSLMESTLNPKGENNERIGSCSTLFGSQHFGGRGLCWSFGMGTKKVTNKSIIHMNLQNQTS
jgi:hypothetical protein